MSRNSVSVLIGKGVEIALALPERHKITSLCVTNYAGIVNVLKE